VAELRFGKLIIHPPVSHRPPKGLSEMFGNSGARAPSEATQSAALPVRNLWPGAQHTID
jgi:hypothetical protein